LQLQLQGSFRNFDSTASVTCMPTQKLTQTPPMCMTSPLSKHVQPIVHPDLIHKRGKNVPGHTALRLLTLPVANLLPVKEAWLTTIPGTSTKQNDTVSNHLRHDAHQGVSDTGASFSAYLNMCYSTAHFWALPLKAALFLLQLALSCCSALSKASPSLICCTFFTRCKLTLFWTTLRC
jgi:hypothetical protein